MSHRSQLVRFTLVALVSFIAQTAWAEPSTRSETRNDGGYSYEFKDDGLLASTISNVGDMYKGRPKFARVLLLRPRVSLVQEIFKSAEDL
jgi:hypothetical protein